MQVGLRHFDSQTLDWLAGALRSGEHTRHALTRELCERTGWRNALGRLCLSAAAKALPALAERVGIELPPARAVPDPTVAPAVPAGDVPDTRVACALEEFGPVSLDPVGAAADRRLWEAMMEARHPLGWARPPGGQMRYWIRSERHGVLGGIGFGSATWQLRARDEWIGWSADARAANIGRVICNHRFLLLAGVRVHGLASQVLRMAARKVADDWESRYSVRPVAAYTHVGPEHSGYCYHRAGWIVAGRTGGRRARPARCGSWRWRTVGGRRSAMWNAARSGRWPAHMTARTRTGRRGSTDARATPTGGCATASSGWAGPG